MRSRRRYQTHRDIYRYHLKVGKGRCRAPKGGTQNRPRSSLFGAEVCVTEKERPWGAGIIKVVPVVQQRIDN